ncbi:MAG: Nramp family divalent metal transporter [bacterium]
MGSNEQPPVSLSDVHSTVRIPRNVGFLKRLFAFAGPAYLVSVGYMDPGNWATDLEGGARFGYQLLWVLVMSNAMAILLQTLSARLGIVTGRDLAQACRDQYPKLITHTLWIFCEIAIAACDLAEVLGTAIGLNLLFGIPLIYGVIITGFDTILFLAIQHLGIRKMEAFIVMLVSTVGLCFIMELIYSQPVWGEVATGLIPHISKESLYVAIGILGATVMPHNLYLHSALVQTRDVGSTVESKREACKFNLIDTTVALNAALFVNAAILIVAASVFFRNNIVVHEIQQAHELLTPLLGTTLAGTLFAIALIAAGQSSTMTGTLAGQIVMEGFLLLRVRPFVRRLITRLIAIIPAVIVITIKGDRGSYDLLILSQVILSLQLPFAIIPLIRFTSDKSIMKGFVSPFWVKVLAWTTAAIIVVFNVNLLISKISEWIQGAGEYAVYYWILVVPFTVGVAFLLMYISTPKSWKFWRKPERPPMPQIQLSPQHYTKIGVAIDSGSIDSTMLSHAQSLAQFHHAALYVLHVVDGVSGQVFGTDAYDEEARKDMEYIEQIAEQLRNTGLEVHPFLKYGKVSDQIIGFAKENHVELLVMGGHRHSGLKDFFFGTTIPKVRHGLSIPVLVV